MTLLNRLKKLEQEQKPPTFNPWVIYFPAPPQWDDISPEDKARIKAQVAKTITEGRANKQQLIFVRDVPEGFPRN